MRFRHGREWLVYAGAWIPYAAGFYLLFRFQTPRDHWALTDAVLNVFPAALLGGFVFRLLNRMSWPTVSVPRFLAIHSILCISYALGWFFLNQIFLATLGALVSHRWELPGGSLYAIQWMFFSGVMLYLTLAGFHYMLVAQERTRLEEQKRREAEGLRTRAELSALRSQLHPHFLFNALNSVTALVRLDPAKAETALVDLSRMLRYALSSHAEAAQDEVSLRDELEFTDTYLSLEALRLGNRLQIQRDIAPETLDCVLPSLTIQPLVENAIKHSIGPRPTGGKLGIATVCEEGSLVVRIVDDGFAIAPDLDSCTGLGLKNVSRRLDLFYKNCATMTIQGGGPDGFTVTLKLPQEASF